MFNRLIRWLYERCGAHYWIVMVAGEAAASMFVALLTIGVVSTYYDASLRTVVTLAAVAALCTMMAVSFAAYRSRPILHRIAGWRTEADPSPEATVAAWEGAATLTLRQYRRDAGRVNLIAILPTSLLAAALLDIGWRGFLVMLLACLIPAAYATILSYSIGEMFTRPLIQDIAAQLPDDFPFERHGLPVSTRIKVGLPAYTAAAALITAASLGGHQGSGQLALAVLVSLVVGIFVSRELTVLLTEGITDPINHVRTAMSRVRSGDYAARVPVASSDELGELAHDFNLMARGLEEREQMRTAFGTYMDKQIVQLILSGEFPEAGVEVDVSILFCDVRGFTTYAEGAAATEVVATLNTIFSAIVPVVERNGGHVDKFMGDGLLAVFGAPEIHLDHADRAVAAACELVEAAAATGTGLSVAAGVNTGRVVAGSIGGAGRLNFSVIGDAVNVAARVEAATRQTGDDVLITAATRDALVRPLELVSRGSVPLKGKTQPIEVLSPVPTRDPDRAAADRSANR